MKTVAKLKKSEIYISVGEVLDRYQIHVNTLDRWIKKRGFPPPRKIVGKRHFLLESVDAWDCEQSGHAMQPEGETAFGLQVVSDVITDYDGLVAALTTRRNDMGLSCAEIDARAGMQENYTNKLENWRKPSYGRGAGPEILPLWIGGLRVGIVLVAIPRKPRKGKGS